jgi:hypothetical protein
MTFTVFTGETFDEENGIVTLHITDERDCLPCDIRDFHEGSLPDDFETQLVENIKKTENAFYKVSAQVRDFEYGID